MKIVIVGPGAIGLLLYSHIQPLNLETFLLDKSKERAERLRRKGIFLTTVSGSRKIRNVSITSDSKRLPEADLVIIAVKTYQTESAILNASSCVGKGTYVFSLQNGWGNAEILEKYVAPNRILLGVTNNGATLISENEVKEAGRGETIIGSYKEENFLENKTILNTIADLFQRTAFAVRIERNIISVIWSKLIINVGINALSALTRLKNGQLIEIEEIKELMQLLVSEAYQVVKAKNIKLIYSDHFQEVQKVCLKTKDNISSMLQDLLKNKQTEIDAINAVIVKEAEKLGLNARYNKFVTNLIRGIERKNKEGVFLL